MLTRLYVTGFKNLVDTEIRFGPFTCIAGLNGVGKSNIFDAIHFLAQLADRPFVEAALATRGGTDIGDLFTVGGEGKMRFDCDILIPSQGIDDFHQPAEASQTFLNYSLELSLVREEGGIPRIRLTHEKLVYIPRREARKRLGFSHAGAWRDSVVKTSQRRAPFIDMEGDGEKRLVRLSSDKMKDESKSKRGGGRPTDFLANNLPRTALSGAQNADEARTAVLVRREMRSWRILQLEPSALRRPDELQAPASMAVDGEHLPATLYKIARSGDENRVYAELANRLSELVDDVHGIRVDRDDARRLLRLMMIDRGGVELPASSLSDGTLRFVALSVLEQDSDTTGLICLEEPENGIHPERMDAIVELLSDMAIDPGVPVGNDNPLRQVIVSTHSPVVAARARPDELVFADTRDPPSFSPGKINALVVRSIRGTWRDDGISPHAAVGEVMKYLDTLRTSRPEKSGQKTVFEAIAKQLSLPFGA